jgi:hypothetical protein
MKLKLDKIINKLLIHIEKYKFHLIKELLGVVFLIIVWLVLPRDFSSEIYTSILLIMLEL